MINFELQDFFINAGIVGLYNMLCLQDPKETYIKIESNQLYVDKDWLLSLDLAELYFKTLIKRYAKICPLTRILKNLEILKNSDQDIKLIKEQTKKIESALTSNRYKSGYEIVKNNFSSNLYEDLKTFKNSTIDNLAENTNRIIKYFENENLKEMFYIKDIIYFTIKYFWNDISFLNRSNSAKDPKEEFKTTFEEPLKSYLKSEIIGKEFCIECGLPIKGGFKIKTSYINSLTEDFARKNSNYWNFKPNCYVCPKCNFLFGLIPLGFLPYGQNYVFVNNNKDLDTLIKSNEEEVLGDEKLSYYEQYNLTLNKISELNISKLTNLEIITNVVELEHYKFDIISKNILEKLNINKKELNILSKLGVLHYKNETINIYDEVMSYLFDSRSLYPILHSLLVIGIKEKYATVFCKYIYKIENGGKNMTDYSQVFEAGKKMRKAMETRESGRIESICYDMSNMIANNKAEELYNLIFNLSVKTKESFPTELYEMILDKNKIKVIGYAYATGFITGKDDKNE